MEQEEHEQLVTAHRQEPVDQAWARDMRSKVTDTFNATSDITGASLGAVDCRTTSCTVELTWPSYADARMQFARSVEALGIGVPCARRLTLPEPDSQNGPFKAVMLLDCTESRFPPPPPRER